MFDFTWQMPCNTCDLIPMSPPACTSSGIYFSMDFVVSMNGDVMNMSFGLFDHCLSSSEMNSDGHVALWDFLTFPPSILLMKSCEINQKLCCRQATCSHHLFPVTCCADETLMSSEKLDIAQVGRENAFGSPSARSLIEIMAHSTFTLR